MMDFDEIIYAVGLWSLRIVLTLGAVVAALIGKIDVSCILGAAVISTFLLL